jgi:hypothetical protein
MNATIANQHRREVTAVTKLRFFGASGAEILKRQDFFGERAGTRTQDPVIKSHVLYRLSYALHLPDQILKSAGIYQPWAPVARFFPAVLLDWA